MVVILVENFNNKELSMLQLFYEKFMEETRVTIYNAFDYENNKNKLEQPPLLANSWLIECTHTLDKLIIQKLVQLSETNLLIFKVTQKKVTDIEDKLDALHIQYKIIYNETPEPEVVINFIMQQLNISQEKASYLYNYCGKYTPKIVSAVYTLQSLDEITKLDIRRYVERGRQVTTYDLSSFLLGIDEKISYQDAIHIIYNYQYAMKHLLTYLIGVCDEYLCIFGLVSEGVLSLENFKDFRRNTTVKTIKGMKEYRLQKVIEAYNIVSVEKLIYLKAQLKKIPNTKFGATKLILLTKTCV